MGRGNHKDSPGRMVRGRFWVPDENSLYQVTEWMKDGGSTNSLTKLLGCSKETLYKKMKSTDPRLCNEEGQNVLREAVDIGIAYQADFIEAQWWKIIRNEDHRNHYTALKDFYLNVVQKKDPDVIVISDGKQVDKSPEEIAKMLKEARENGALPRIVRKGGE